MKGIKPNQLGQYSDDTITRYPKGSVEVILLVDTDIV